MSLHRHSIRLKNHDYTQPGMYFITICTHRRRCMFGRVNNGIVGTNTLGDLVQEFWIGLPMHHPHVEIDAFAVMPNLLIGVVKIQNTGRGTKFRAPTERYGQRVPDSLPTMVRTYKAAVTRQWGKTFGDLRFVVWQRNRIEWVIRDEGNLIASVDTSNPQRWERDRYHQPWVYGSVAPDAGIPRTSPLHASFAGRTI
jgi:putative transposase